MAERQLVGRKAVSLIRIPVGAGGDEEYFGGIRSDHSSVMTKFGFMRNGGIERLGGNGEENVVFARPEGGFACRLAAEYFGGFAVDARFVYFHLTGDFKGKGP